MTKLISFACWFSIVIIFCINKNSSIIFFQYVQRVESSKYNVLEDLVKKQNVISTQDWSVSKISVFSIYCAFIYR